MCDSFFDFLDTKPDIWITSFWGWHPPTWGGVGFTNKARTETIKSLTSSPFLFVINTTKTAPLLSNNKKGKLVGAYKVIHEIRPKPELVSKCQMKKRHHPNMAWYHTFRAVEAWSLRDAQEMTEFYPKLYEDKIAQSVSTWGKKLPNEQVKKLKTYAWKEVAVYPQDA